MSPQMGKVMIIGVIVLIVVSGIWAFRVVWMNRCQEDDIRICALVKQLQVNDSTKIAGTYSELFDTIPIYSVEWTIDGFSQELRKIEAEQETMHLIHTKEAVYLRDYTDKKWWKQQSELVEKFDIKLPFDPAIYFGNIISDIQDPQTSLSYTHQDVCGAKTCYVFTLEKDNEQTTMFYLDEENDQVQQILITDGKMQQKIIFAYEDYSIEIPKSDVKIATKNQNIFLENFLQQTTIQKDKPEYIQEFEEVQSQLEQNDNQYVFESPTSSP